jgi:hypothetical protein
VLLVAVLDFYYEHDVKHKASGKPAFRAMQLVTEFASEKIGPTARVAAFSALRQRDFMRWCVEKYGHGAGTIARNLSVVSAAFGFARKPQVVRDGFGNESEVQRGSAAHVIAGLDAARVDSLVRAAGPIH